MLKKLLKIIVIIVAGFAMTVAWMLLVILMCIAVWTFLVWSGS